MKIRRFFEKSEEDIALSMMQEALFNIIDEMDDLVTVSFNKENETWYTITIIPISDQVYGPPHTLQNEEEINIAIERCEFDIKVLKQLKLSMDRLTNNDVIERYVIVRDERIFTINVVVNTETTNFIWVNDKDEIYIDEDRLEQFFLDRFDIVVNNCGFSEEYNKVEDDNYIDLNIDFETRSSKSTILRIKKHMMSLQFSTNYDNEDMFDKIYILPNNTGIALTCNGSISSFT